MAETYSSVVRDGKMKSRVNKVPYGAQIIREQKYPDGRIETSLVSDSTSHVNLRQITVSEGHDWDGIYQPDRGDVGGDFYTENVKILSMSPAVASQFHMQSSNPKTGEYLAYSSDGGYIPDFTWPDGTPSALKTSLPANLSNVEIPSFASSRHELEAWGTTAIARCSPTQSSAQIFVAMKELLSDGLPRIPGISPHRIKQVLEDFRKKKGSGVFTGTADEYLNLVFGWQPLLSDLSATFDAMVEFDRNLNQLRRDSAKLVRRSYGPIVEPNEVVHSEKKAKVVPILPSHSNSGLFGFGGGAVNLSVTEERTRKFSGAFQYYLETGDGLADRLRRSMQEADATFGAAVTPENVWNASPWTWLIDWFVNAGDVISNLSDMLTYGLVLRYGYVQEKSSRTYSYSQVGTRYKSGPAFEPSLVLRHTVKRRIRATPYGFGITFDSLSNKQIAILAALGITRM